MDLLSFLRSFVTPNKLSLFDDVIEKRTRFLTVVLEDLYQSHNASAVLRSCDCFGIQDIHIIENQNTWTTHRDIERGSSKWLTLTRYNEKEENTVYCLDRLREKGYSLIATTPRAQNTIGQLRLDRPVALVFGTEKEGVSEEVLAKADEQVRIPMYGFTESFNISVAAAISLHNLRERMTAENIPGSLSADEKEEILIQWCKNVLPNAERFVREYNRRKKA